MIQKLMALLRGPQPLLNDIAILFLRFAFGGLMVVGHGWSKLAGWGELSNKFADPLGISSPVSLAGAILAEVVGSVAVILGLYTRLAALLLAFTMAVAAFIVRADDPFFIHKGLSKEPAFLYLLAFLALAMLGSGRFSLDRLLWRTSTEGRS